ncbi:MAG: signal peptidase, partial [Planctomycetaceae bacterium]|nr:signal peptidase [Planctomycetaceae bacterium]
GKPVCCNTHLQEMPPVSMKMAKLQKATLDPNKISGRCGRLKCCLRYEYDTYEEYRRELPSVGATVVTRDGQGKVIGQEILARKLIVAFEDGRRVMTDESEIVTVVSKGTSGRKSGGGKVQQNPE